MRFSTRSTYGLRAVINLAMNQGPEGVSLKTIAEEEEISKKYLEQLFSKLKKAGLVQAEKGARGGYFLDRPATKISVFEVLGALEGGLAPFHCVNEKGTVYCKAECRCRAIPVLIKVQEAVNKTLKSVKISDLI